MKNLKLDFFHKKILGKKFKFSFFKNENLISKPETEKKFKINNNVFILD